MIGGQKKRIARGWGAVRIWIVVLALVAGATSCLRFQESAFDATGAGIALPLLFAAATTFAISGTLRDPDGAKIANTTMNIISPSTSEITAATTDSNGNFSANLKEGTHTLSFSFNSQTLDLTLTVTSTGASTGTSTTGVYYLDANRAQHVSFLAVAGGQNGSTCMYWYSADLINWTSGLMPTNLDTCMAIRDVVYANGVFVAVGATGPSRCYTAYSTDGINWIQTSCPAGSGVSGLFSVAYGNGMFVAVGQYDTVKPTVRVSSDNGLTWSEINPGVAGTLDWQSIVYNDQKFFAAETSGGPATVIYNSSNPASTSFAATGAGCANTGTAIPHGGVKGPGFKWALATSRVSEGAIYFNGTTCAYGNAFTGQEANIEGIAYDPLENRFAIIGLTCNVDTSTDGTTWTAPTFVNSGSCAPNVQFRVIKYSAQRKEFIALGRQTTSFLPTVATSSTGAGNSWTVNQFVGGSAVNDDPRALAIRE